MIKKVLALGIPAFLVLPFFVAAQDLGGVTSFFNQIRAIVDLLVPLVFTLALLGFFWGLARYLFAGTDEGKVAGKQIMVWGIVALFVMASVWGLVAFIQNIIGVDTTSTQVVPSVT